jgi:hypothetical protein
MSEAMDAKAPASKSDLWIAVGVIGCLALGASATFMLSSSHNAESEAARAKEAPRGAPIVARGTQTAPTASTATASAASAQPIKSDGDYTTVTFDTLSSYYYEVPNLEPSAVQRDAAEGKRPKDQIPAPIRAFDKKKISIQGFMIPIKLEKGATKEFLIVKDQSVCCWGRVPRMNEWVSVRMSGGKTTKFIPDQPVTIFGTLQVSEEIEKGEVLSIYRLDADDVAGPLDL